MAIIEAINRLLANYGLEAIDEETSVNSLQDILDGISAEDHELLAEAATLSFRDNGATPNRNFRHSLEFLVASNRPSDTLVYTKDPKEEHYLSPQNILETVKRVNKALELLHDMALIYGVPIFQLLGLRNLSSFVGEVFAREFYTRNQGKFIQNPNQDGYPDLLALTEQGKKYIESLRKAGKESEKEHWSPYPYGGIEVKATCGNTPPARVVPKPKIGESRYPILKSAEWKAHHRQTNNLLAIHWDFIDGLPTVLATFFRNDLIEEDWGRIVQPRESGGRTTSVSLMVKRQDPSVGVWKMGQGCLVLCDVPDIKDALTRVYNIRNTLGTLSKP